MIQRDLVKKVFLRCPGSSLGTEPPQKLIQEWIQLKMNNIDAHAAGVRINQFETELKYVENVSEERQDQYREAQENVQVNRFPNSTS